MELTHLSLFSGIGGMDLSAEWAGFKTIGQCEFADFPSEILKKHWPEVEKWRNVREITATNFTKRTGYQSPTIVSGGFPCQPHSVAGKRMAADDERDLWGELLRVFCDTGGGWLVGENVPGLLTSENGWFFGRILNDLAEIGCNAWWYCFPAYHCGAKYIGERVCIVASADSKRFDIVAEKQEKQSDAKYMEMLGQWETRQNDLLLYPRRDESKRSSGFKRNDDGVPRALDRLKAYGNAVNPYQFYPVFKAIADTYREI